MQRLKTFQKLYILTSGSSYWNTFCNLSISSINIYINYLKIDIITHPFWSYDPTAHVKTQIITLPQYSKLFKI